MFNRTGKAVSRAGPRISRGVSLLKGPFSGPNHAPRFRVLASDFVDRTGSGFGPLAFDTTPGYVDTEPFPNAPAKWTYRALYRVGDQRVGQWSKSVSIAVGG